MGEYFIRIEDVKDTRRTVLESSKASINILKGYQEILRIRGEKNTMMIGFRRELKELTMLMNRMEELMPQFSEKEILGMKEAAMMPALGRKKKIQTDERQVFLGTPGPARPKEGLPLPSLDEPAMDMNHLEEKLRRVEDQLNDL